MACANHNSSNQKRDPRTAPTGLTFACCRALLQRRIVMHSPSPCATQFSRLIQGLSWDRAGHNEQRDST